MPELTEPMERLVRSLMDDLDASRDQGASLEAELVSVRSRVDAVRALADEWDKWAADEHDFPQAATSARNRARQIRAALGEVSQ